MFPAGWTIRNHFSLSPESPTGTLRAISTLSHGAYPGFVYKDPGYKYYPYREDPSQPEFGSSFKSFRRILWERAKERPLRYLSWYLLEKPYYLWSWNMLQAQGDVYQYAVKTSLYKSSRSANLTRKIIKYLHPVFLILGLTGVAMVFIEWRKDKNKVNCCSMHLFFAGICIYYTLLYTITAPWPRYSVPLRPEFYLFSIWCLQVLADRVKERRSHQ
jgi:hypothetical protein